MYCHPDEGQDPSANKHQSGTELLQSLSLYKEKVLGDEAGDARALNGVRELALVPSADAGAASGHDLGVRGDEPAQSGGILIVDDALIIGAKGADGVFGFAFGHVGRAAHSAAIHDSRFKIHESCVMNRESFRVAELD